MLKSRISPTPMTSRLLWLSLAVILLVSFVWMRRSEGADPRSGATLASPDHQADRGADPADVVLENAEGALTERHTSPLSRYRVSGAIQVHGTLSATGPIMLTWRATGADDRAATQQVVVTGSAEVWEADFEGDAHQLVRATCGDGELRIVEPVELAPGSERADVELLAPGHHLVDVRSAEPPFERLRDLTVSIATADALSRLSEGMQVRRQRGGSKDEGVSRLLLSSEALDEAENGGLQRAGQSAPLVFRSADLAGRMTISAEGRMPLSLDCTGLAPITSHVLAEAVQLHVTFLNPPTPRAIYDVAIVVDDGVLAEERGVRPVPLTLRNIPRRAGLRISVVRHGPLGDLLSVIDAPLELSNGRDSYFIADLAQRTAPDSIGSLAVEVSAQAPVPRMDSWFVVLQPRGRTQPGLTPGRKLSRPETSYLKSWNVLATSQRYHKLFDGIAVGDYTLTLHPIGMTYEVSVVGGSKTALTLAVPSMAELHIWPIDSQGGALTEPTKIGNLAWRVCKSDEAEITLEDVALQRAHMAAFSESGWSLVAPEGERVQVQFIGNPAHRAQKLDLVLRHGRTDETMQFHGL